MASVGGRSFLELLIKQLKNQGIVRLVMCTGYLGDQIEREFGDGSNLSVSIEYSREHSPLGTAGALRLAAPHLAESQEFIVMNGDSFLEVDFQQLIRFHRIRKGLASIAVRHVANTARFGTVQVNREGRVIAFAEKTDSESAGLINGGVYVFGKAALDWIPEGRSSLETDIFPQLLRDGVFALEQKGMFIDIGTPDDYARAQLLCAEFEASSTSVQG